MRLILTARPPLGAALIMLWLTTAVFGQSYGTYYVAVSGSDGASGSVSEPFATVTHALGLVVAGDTIYVRGGTYESGATIRVDQSGADSARIHIFAFPGEAPVFDFAGNDREGLDIRGSFVHVRGLTFENAGRSGVFIKGGAGNIVERVTTRFNKNSGVQVEDGASDNLILNTDSYGNYDPQNNGENADGFAVKFDVGPGNTLRGCRAWDNSDDGFDFWEAGNGVTVESSWAFRNGIDIWDDPDFQGDSNGFKLGHGSGAHRLVRNLAWGHLNHGFDVNGNATGVTLFNNTAFNNQDRNFYFDEDTSAHVLRNNISLSGRVLMFDAVDDSSNSWNGFNVGGVDFLSLSDAGTDGPRESDGSLPSVAFLHLRTDSKLVDAGTDVGIPFEGAAPDLGAFEASGMGVSTEPTELPSPAGVALSAYPNPFSHVANLMVEVAIPTFVRIRIYDVSGRQVDVVFEGPVDGRRTVIPWRPDAVSLSRGVYFVRIEDGRERVVTPLVFTGTD